tara:strand:- start:418 stop:1491 length:1074 start_codon:yes stop_codon:yes gene_type:complete
MLNNINTDMLDDIQYFKNNIDKIKATIEFIEKNEINKNFQIVKKNKKIKCKYGTTCCNELCTRQHPIGWDAQEARKRLSNITCKYGDKCTAKNCLYYHKNKDKCVTISPLSLKPLSSPKLKDKIENRTSRSESMTSVTSRPNQNYICLNVEYIANGFSHNDRIPCWIVMVDYEGNIIFDEKINPSLSKNAYDIVSTLEPITGITMEILENEGKSYNDVMRSLKEILDENVVFVGYNIDVDILKLGLESGIDYKNFIDIAVELRISQKYKNTIKKKYFSINQQKKILLNKDNESSNISDDTKIIMSLFKNWIKPGETKKARAKKKLLESKFTPSNKEHYVIDGVCCAQYRKDKCICNN